MVDAVACGTYPAVTLIVAAPALIRKLVPHATFLKVVAWKCLLHPGGTALEGVGVAWRSSPIRVRVVRVVSPATHAQRHHAPCERQEKTVDLRVVVSITESTGTLGYKFSTPGRTLGDLKLGACPLFAIGKRLPPGVR